MIYKLLFCWLLLFATVAALQAQEKPKLPDCRKYPVDDSDKRDIADRDSFTLDADSDGKPDTVTTKTYAVKIKRNRAAMNKIEPPPGETHWIAFDLKMSGGRVLKRFFKFNYGTDQYDLPVYALVLCSVNQDDKPDLLFYAGDEAGDEAVILANVGNRFKVHSRRENIDYRKDFLTAAL